MKNKEHNKKVSFLQLDRADLANPYRHLSHKELLRLGGVKTFEKGYFIENLPDGRIKVVNKDKSKDKLDTTKHS